MTNPKPKTYEQMVEEAANKYQKDVERLEAPFQSFDFKIGVNWCRKNPPEEFVKREDVEKLILDSRKRFYCENCGCPYCQKAEYGSSK